MRTGTRYFSFPSTDVFYTLTVVQQKLRDLGIVIVTEASKCSHVASPNIIRTHKFIAAIAYAPMFLSIEFLDDCLTKNEFRDPEDYILEDRKNESRFSFDLAASLERAESNKNNLLGGQTIFCVENINGGFVTFSSIIEANGGHCAMYRGRGGTTVSKATTADAMEVDGEEPPSVYLISATNEDNKKLWPKFRTMVADAGLTPKIVKVDWLLDSAMAQEMKWKDTYELK